MPVCEHVHVCKDWCLWLVHCLWCFFHEERENKRGRRECKCSCAAMSLYCDMLFASLNSLFFSEFKELHQTWLYMFVPFPPQCRCVYVSVCVWADNNSPIGIQWRELQDLAAPFPRMGSQSGDCARLWRSHWNGWVSVLLFLLFFLFHLSFSCFLCLSVCLLFFSLQLCSEHFHRCWVFPFHFLVSLTHSPCPTHLSTIPPPVSLYPSIPSCVLFSSSVHLLILFPLHRNINGPVQFDGFEWNLNGSLQFVASHTTLPPSPFCLSISPPLRLCHPSPLLASIPLSVSSSFSLHSVGIQTHRRCLGLFPETGNEWRCCESMCVCEGIAISVSVSIIWIAFHVCASVTQCREGRGVCSASVCGIGTTEGYDGDQCV